MKRKTIYLMIISTLAFAFVNAIIKELKGFSAFQLVFFRSIIPLVICLVQFRIRGLSPWGNNKPILLLRGVSGAVALFMMFVLIKNISLGLAVMLQYLSPIFTAIIGFFWLKEKLSMRQWIAMLICVVGVYFIKSNDDLLTLNMLLLGLGAACLSGLAYNCVRICRTTDHPLVAVFYFPLVATPIAFLLTIFNDLWIWPSMTQWIIIVVLGSLTQLAQVTMTKALQGDKVANAAVFKYLGIVYAFFISWIWFGEVFSWKILLSTLLVLSGIFVFSWNFKGGRKET